MNKGIYVIIQNNSSITKFSYFSFLGDRGFCGTLCLKSHAKKIDYIYKWNTYKIKEILINKGIYVIIQHNWSLTSHFAPAAVLAQGFAYSLSRGLPVVCQHHIMLTEVIIIIKFLIIVIIIQLKMIINK
jgi:hypothetical protein